MRYHEGEDTLPLDIIKVGKVMYLRENISELSVGGNAHFRKGYRGEPVRVLNILIFERTVAPTPGTKVTSCELDYRFIVHKLRSPAKYAFGVYRREIMPTDPLITKNDIDNYLLASGDKNLTDRFGGETVCLD